MHTRILQLLYIFLLSFSCTAVHAQLKFSVKTSSPTVGKNENFELKLMVENARDVEQILPPSLNDFTVLSGPNQESGMESINGNTRQYTGITYILQPKKPGTFIIASAKAKADGKILNSDPVIIKVTNQTVSNSRPNANSPFTGLFEEEPEPAPQFNEFILRKGEKLYDKIKKNIFIRIETDKTSCFIGEPVVVTYKLYTRLKSESNIVKNPSFNGFSVIDLLPPGNISSTVERFQGRDYNVYVLRKAQLYPLQAGETELESAEVENNVHFLKQEYLDQRQDLLQGYMQSNIPADAMINEKITLQSQPVMISVKALPDAGKPASFSGAVGGFSIAAEVEKNKFTTDDAGKLRILIHGAGNITLITAPDFTWPAGIEGYEPATKENLNKFTVPVSGNKLIEYPFTVAKEGNYTLPPLEFSYFDAAAGKYKVINTKAISIAVTKGTGIKDALPATIVNKTGKEKFFDRLFTERWMIIVPVTLLIIIGILIWLRADRKKQLAREKMQIPEVEVNMAEEKKELFVADPLAVSKEKLAAGNTKDFYYSINHELKEFLSGKLKIPAALTDKKSINEALDRSGIPLGTCLEIQKLLDDIEWQLYTPFADESRAAEIYERAGMVVHTLNRPAADLTHL
ncbi:MAG: BatD family protein [Ferruginibacter sp.]